MDFFETVETQRAIRHLKRDPIPDDILHRILQVAICAPSGGNRQGWRFIIIRDPALRTQIGALYRECFGELLKIPYYRDAVSAPPDSREGKLLASARHLGEHLGEAPVLIVACIDTDGVPPGLMTGASIYPAVQNLMLAARALGIGTTLTTIHRFRDAALKQLLGIPAGVETAALIPLGYPLRNFGRAPRKPLEDVTFDDRWGQHPRATGRAARA